MGCDKSFGHVDDEAFLGYEMAPCRCGIDQGYATMSPRECNPNYRSWKSCQETNDEDETVDRLVLKNINPLHRNEELNLSQTFYVQVENDKSHVFKYIFLPHENRKSR